MGYIGAEDIGYLRQRCYATEQVARVSPLHYSSLHKVQVARYLDGRQYGANAGACIGLHATLHCKV